LVNNVRTELQFIGMSWFGLSWPSSSLAEPIMGAQCPGQPAALINHTQLLLEGHLKSVFHAKKPVDIPELKQMITDETPAMLNNVVSQMSECLYKTCRKSSVIVDTDRSK
jgi:hypothetical protein